MLADVEDLQPEELEFFQSIVQSHGVNLLEDGDLVAVTPCMHTTCVPKLVTGESVLLLVAHVGPGTMASGVATSYNEASAAAHELLLLTCECDEPCYDSWCQQAEEKLEDIDVPWDYPEEGDDDE
jgi:hypothetical protein